MYMTCYLNKGSADTANVKQVQLALQNKGYYKGCKIDGDYGAYTVKAVKQFQQAQGLIVDGCIGCETWPKLVGTTCPWGTTASTATTSSSTQTSAGSYENCKNTTLQKGSAGECVTYAQTKLKAWGFYTRQVDGDYGDYTVAAVKKFQGLTGHTQDGVLGPKTWGSFPTYSTEVVTTPTGTVISKVTSTVTSSTIYQQGKSALGGDFTSITGIISLLKRKGVNWINYNNDRYKFSEEAARFKQALPANCSDLSQFLYMLAKSLDKYTVLNFVHLKCKSGGHIILEVLGGEFNTLTWIDISAILKNGYGFNTGWCFKGVNKPTYSIISRNDPWLLSDDGIT